MSQKIECNPNSLFSDANTLMAEMNTIANTLCIRLLDKIRSGEDVENYRGQLKAIEANIAASETRPDGKINGTNDKTRAAQLAAACMEQESYSLTEVALASAAHTLALAEADIEYWRLKASFARSKARLIAAQLEYMMEVPA